MFQKKLHPFYFCNNFVDPELICIIFGSDTPEENCNKICIVFPNTPIFCALLYLVTQATNLTNIHSDKHQNWMVKSGKSQDKNADKTCKNKSRQSEQVLKVSSVTFLTGAQPYVPLVNGLVDDWLLYIRPPCNQASLQIIHITYRCLIHSLLHDTANLVIHWKINWQQICQKSSKSAQDQQSYCKNKKDAVFFETQYI